MRPDGIHRLLAAGIRCERKRKGWTQADLGSALRGAGLASWRTGTVGSVEAGLRCPALGELLTICAVLGVGFADLIPADSGTASLAPGTYATAPQVRAIIAGNGGTALLAGARPSALPSDAERHAARKLGVDVESVRGVARALWGRSFDVERDSRVPADCTAPRARQARRGLAARVMTGELRRALDPAGTEACREVRPPASSPG